MLGRAVAGAALAGGATAVARRLIGQNRGKQASHVSESARDYRTTTGARVLILGAGFGGLTAALELDRRLDGADDVSVLIVDEGSSLLFTPLLWTVADGRANATGVVVPIRAFQRGRQFHLLHAEVQRIDLDAREVQTSSGSRPYDILVIALGSVTAVPDLPGLRQHARLFYTPADAIELRNHLIDAVEAAHYCEDEAERSAWLTFVVGGGGDTGVELAATIRDFLTRGLLTEYPWLASARVRVVVVGRSDRLVPMSRPRRSKVIRRVLEEGGVEVLTGASIEGVTERVVQTSEGEIPARTLFWTAGISVPRIVRDQPVEHARNGAILVDERLRVPGRPEVYAIGDAAWTFDTITGDPVPPTAQAAEHQGRYVARAIAAGIAGRRTRPFRFRPRGDLSLLGHRTGVATIGPLTFTGLPAWLLWHGFYLTHLPTWRNRLLVGGSWALAALTGRETAQLRLRPAQAKEMV